MFKCKIGIFEILGRCLIGFVGEGTELDPFRSVFVIRTHTDTYGAIWGSMWVPGTNFRFFRFSEKLSRGEHRGAEHRGAQHHDLRYKFVPRTLGTSTEVHTTMQMLDSGCSKKVLVNS